MTRKINVADFQLDTTRAEEPTTKDVRVVADNNFHLIVRVLARLGEASAAIAKSTTEFEDLNRQYGRYSKSRHP